MTFLGCIPPNPFDVPLPEAIPLADQPHLLQVRIDTESLSVVFNCSAFLYTFDPVVHFVSFLTAQCQKRGSIWPSFSGLVLLLLHGNQGFGWGEHGQELPGGKHGLLSTLPLSGIPPSSLDKHAGSFVQISKHHNAKLETASKAFLKVNLQKSNPLFPLHWFQLDFIELEKWIKKLTSILMYGYRNIACVLCVILIFPLSHHTVLSECVYNPHQPLWTALPRPPSHHHRSSPPKCLTLRTWKTWWVWKMASGVLGASLSQSRSWRLQNLGLHPTTSPLS